MVDHPLTRGSHLMGAGWPGDAERAYKAYQSELAAKERREARKRLRKAWAIKTMRGEA